MRGRVTTDLTRTLEAYTYHSTYEWVVEKMSSDASKINISLSEVKSSK
jgi:hypothetical protein